MKQKIERAKKLHAHALDTLNMLAEELAGIQDDYEGIARRQNPNPLPTRGTIGSKTGIRAKLPDKVLAKNRRTTEKRRQKKNIKSLSNSYIKQLVSSASHGTIKYKDVTPEMIEIKREQVKLKRGIHSEQKITQGKLDASWE